MSTIKINRTSARLTEDISQAGSRAQLFAAGLKREDFGKAQVGIASIWYEGNPCNMHLNDLADEVKKGVHRRRPGRHAVQHHRRLRRHLDGHRRA